MLVAVLDALPLGVWIMDRNGRITHGNPAGRRIWAGARYVRPEQFGEYKGWWADSGKRIAPNEWAAARAIHAQAARRLGMRRIGGIESYITDRSTATFPHGLCPECSGCLYPDLLTTER